MREKLENGEHMDSKTVSKHKNDIFRLLTAVVPSRKVEIAAEIEKDINMFIGKIKKDRPDLTNLGIKNTSVDELIAILESIYLVTSESL